MFAFILSCFLIFKPFFIESSDHVRNNSTNKAQVLAYQALALEAKRAELNQNTLNSSRAPASSPKEQDRNLGEIGENEQGQPYHYEIVKGPQYTKVILWTDQHSLSKTEVLIPSENP